MPSTLNKLSLEEVRAVIDSTVRGKIIPHHDEHGHHYEFVESGKVVDSVTQKISVPRPHLLKWYGRKAVEWMEPLWPTVTPENREDLFTQSSLAGERVRDQAGDTGTTGHDAIEAWINAWIANGKPPETIVTFIRPDGFGHYNPSAIAVARSAQKFFKDHPFYVPVTAELLVGDAKVNTAGTLDVLLMDTWTGKLIVGDWKSSNSVSDDYAMQVAAYRHCLQAMTGLRLASWCLIVKLSKQYDKYEKFIVKRPAQAFRMYQHSAAQYDWLMNGQEKLVSDKRTIKI